MGSLNLDLTGELQFAGDDFFAPVAADLIDGLIGSYNATRQRLEALAQAVRGAECHGVLHYFIDGNVPEQSLSLPKTVDALFRVEGAVAQLNADFWSRALRLTDVLDCMPQKRRDEWFTQIRNPAGKKAKALTRWEIEAGTVQKEWEIEPLPAFEEGTVRSTLAGLLYNRATFFAERVDGIFRALSREHVTNCPQGFRKRMILLRAITCFGNIDHSTEGVINDLRCVIARFMGRDEPKYGATSAVIREARKHNGQWMAIDGGSLRIRIYNGRGTAHLEVHPDMAWRLNAMLASLYPAVIPAEFRTQPKRSRKIKDFELFDQLLPFAVLEALGDMKPGWRARENPGFNEPKFVDIPNTLRFGHRELDKTIQSEAEKVLEAIGGVRDKEGNCAFWRFDYEPSAVLGEIICGGRIPDQRSHQFYPTPEAVAVDVMEIAEEGASEATTWLEPSAGQGGLADLMPKAMTYCVEISPLHCNILKAKGHNVIESDFLAWRCQHRFDRIAMNPPFSEGRWQAHLEHAAGMLSPGGRLVAVLPASAKGKTLLPGLKHTWSRVYENEFAGTGVSVAILTLDS